MITSLPLALLLVLERPLWLAILPGAICVAGNAWPQMFAGAAWGDPVSIGSLIACLIAPMLGLALLRRRLPFPVKPMRRWAYAIYPLHFLVLLGAGVVGALTPGPCLRRQYSCFDKCVECTDLFASKLAPTWTTAAILNPCRQTAISAFIFCAGHRSGQRRSDGSGRLRI